MPWWEWLCSAGRCSGEARKGEPGPGHGISMGFPEALGGLLREHGETTTRTGVDLQHPGPMVGVEGEVDAQLERHPAGVVHRGQNRTHMPNLRVHLVENHTAEMILGRRNESPPRSVHHAIRGALPHDRRQKVPGRSRRRDDSLSQDPQDPTVRAVRWLYRPLENGGIGRACDHPGVLCRNVLPGAKPPHPPPHATYPRLRDAALPVHETLREALRVGLDRRHPQLWMHRQRTLTPKLVPTQQGERPPVPHQNARIKGFLVQTIPGGLARLSGVPILHSVDPPGAFPPGAGLSHHPDQPAVVPPVAEHHCHAGIPQRQDCAAHGSGLRGSQGSAWIDGNPHADGG